MMGKPSVNGDAMGISWGYNGVFMIDDINDIPSVI